MSRQQTRTFLAAATLALLSFGASTGFATAAFVEVAPVGDGAGEIARCAKYEDAINSWADAAAEAGEKGDKRARARANRNIKNLMDKATDDGCFLIHN